MSFSYRSVVDRIYKRYSSCYDNIAYLHHPSGVTVIVLRQIPTSEVVEIDFSSAKKNGVDRSTNTVVGKGKKGGLPLQKETRLCKIRCKDGQEIIIRAGVKGNLAEVNDRLKTHPDLVRTAPENQGYIAIITYGAGKRIPDDFGEQLPAKRVPLITPTEQSYAPTKQSYAQQEESNGNTQESGVPLLAPPKGNNIIEKESNEKRKADKLEEHLPAKRVSSIILTEENNTKELNRITPDSNA